jgi:cytochrome c-type biogenesis protein
MSTSSPESPSEARGNLRAAAVLIVLALAIGGGYVAWQGLKESGEQAPDFTIATTGYEDSNFTPPWNFTLSDHAGKVILLDMMAVHCPGCDILAQEVLTPLYAEYGNRTDFVLLSVDVWASPAANQGIGGETNADIIDFQQRYNFQWPHAQDTDGVFSKYSTVPIPMLVLINKEGNIVMEKRGQPALEFVTDRIELALEDKAETVSVVRLNLPLMALVAGIASFFAPCSVGLIPAYLGILLKGTKEVSETERFAKTMGGGLLTAAGIVTLYAAVALLLYLAADIIQPIIVNAVPYVAIALILFGLTMFRTGMWDGVAKRMGMGKVDGRKGFYAFGVGYGLAAFGCTGPIFLPVLLAAFLGGAAYGFFIFGIYAASIAALILMASALVASGHVGGLNKILSKTEAIAKVAAVLVIMGAIWIWSTHYQATGGWF